MPCANRRIGINVPRQLHAFKFNWLILFWKTFFGLKSWCNSIKCLQINRTCVNLRVVQEILYGPQFLQLLRTTSKLRHHVCTFWPSTLGFRSISLANIFFALIRERKSRNKSNYLSFVATRHFSPWGDNISVLRTEDREKKRSREQIR